MKIKKILAVLSACTLMTAVSVPAECLLKASAVSETVTVHTMKAEDFLGTWVCERCAITISEETDGNGYMASVHWGSSAANSAEWTYRHCKFSSANSVAYFVCKGEATSSEVIYAENGTKTTIENYIEGNGSFSISEGILTWTEAENSGADMYFTKTAGIDKTAKPYLGIWGSQKFSVELSEEADKSGYQIVVLWKSGAATATAWTYHHCVFVEGTTEASFICTGEAYQTEITYSEDGSETSTQKNIAGNVIFSIANGTLIWNDAEIDFSKDLTFVKAETGLKPDANAEDYFGIWGSGKCNIQLSKETEGEGYRAVVYWTNTAATATEWICKNCTFNVEEAGVSFICNGGVSRMELTFAEDGTEISAETYTKGSSSFIIINDTLTWNDNEEDSGAGMLFKKAQVTYQAGDADGSGEVDILDVITVNKSILGKELMTEAQIKAVDFNGNGKPDSSESLTILKYIVGLITDFHA